MSYIKHKHIEYVNSSLRLNGSHTDFNCKIVLPVDEQYTHCALLDFVCPGSFYSVTTRNNSIVVEENSLQRVVAVDVGNYDIKSFRAVLQNALNSGQHTGYSYTITYNSSTTTVDNGLYTYTCTTGGNPQPKFLITGGLYEQMGFDMDSVYVFSSDTLTSTNVVNFRPKTRIQLHCSDMVGEFSNNILQQIIDLDGDFKYIQFVNNNIQETCKKFTKTKTEVYNFQIRDRDGQLLDTNGIPVTFSVLFFEMDDTYRKLLQAVSK